MTIFLIAMAGYSALYILLSLGKIEGEEEYEYYRKKGGK